MAFEPEQWKQITTDEVAFRTYGNSGIDKLRRKNCKAER